MNETLLHEEINSSLKEMNEGLAGELGSEQYKEAANACTKLIDKVIEFKKLAIEEEQKKLDRESNERVALEKIRAEEQDKKEEEHSEKITEKKEFNVDIQKDLAFDDYINQLLSKRVSPEELKEYEKSMI